MSIADKAIETVTKNVSLALQLKDAEAKIAVLQHEKSDLSSRLSQAEEKSALLEKKIVEIHSITLSEKHEMVLIAVSIHSGQYPAVLAKATGLSEAETTVKLNYLSSLDLLHFKEMYLTDTSNPIPQHKPINIWFVSKAGHSYINVHNLNSKIA